jgi:RNA polymerase sigma factor (sigma-70 family)
MESQHSSIILQQFLADPQNREIFGNFAEKYQPRIKQICLNQGLQDADADDLTATILLRFCERDVFDGFVYRSHEQFRGWLNKVVRNDVYNFLRTRGRKPDTWSVGNTKAQEFLRNDAECIVNELHLLCDKIRTRVEKGCDRVKECVKDQTWQVFHMAVFEERTVDEVTQQSGMSKVAVWQAISRVRRKLREELVGMHEILADEN